MKATWRQEFASSWPVLSYELPVHAIPSSGTRFHSLQATSQALQPMHTVVSVKKPMRGWICRPYVVCPSAATVPFHELAQLRPARTAARTDVAGARLDLLDVDVRVERQMEEVVRAVARRDAAAAPVIRQSDLVHATTLNLDRSHAIGDHHACLDGRACGDDRRPAAVLETALAREPWGDLAEERRLAL